MLIKVGLARCDHGSSLFSVGRLTLSRSRHSSRIPHTLRKQRNAVENAGRSSAVLSYYIFSNRCCLQVALSGQLLSPFRLGIWLDVVRLILLFPPRSVRSCFYQYYYFIVTAVLRLTAIFALRVRRGHMKADLLRSSAQSRIAVQQFLFVSCQFTVSFARCE